MNIRHECPLPDLTFAVAAPLLVQTSDGTILPALRWSLEGVWIDAQGHDLTRDTAICIPFQGVHVSFPIKLKATDEAGHYAFVELTVRQRETLAVFYQGLLSGKMVATGDIITSLDTPVDLVPMGETESEKAVGVDKVKPRVLRIISNVALYVFLALFLGGFVGGQIWQRLSHITLDHGRFIAPITHYAAPDTGYVERLYVRVGETVRKGDVIARLEDPDRESDVEEERAEILIAEQRLDSARERLAQHITERPRYRAVHQQAFDRLWQPWQAHDPRTVTYPADIQIAWDRLYRFDRGHDLTPGGYHDIEADLRRQVEELGLNLRWKRELRHRRSAADEYVIRARTSGTIFAIHPRKGEFVRRGELIAEIEEDTLRNVVGWLDDHMVTSVYIGMPAKISYNLHGKLQLVQGTIVDLQAGSDPNQPDRYGLVVTVKAEGVDLLKSRKWFRRNAPAKIQLQRQLLKGLLGGGGHEGS